MNLKIKEFDIENIKSQLNQDTLNLDEDSADTFIQTLWKQVEINDKFITQIIEALCNEAQYHNKISLVECEEHENHLYFQERKYMLNSDKLCLHIIQLAHDNVVDDHSERAKSYELISWAYWWSNIYKYVTYWSRWVEYLSSSQVFDLKSVELNWNFFEKVSNWVEKLNLSTQVELRNLIQ